MKNFIECQTSTGRMLISIDSLVYMREQRIKKTKFVDEVQTLISTLSGDFLVDEFYDDVIQKIAEASK